MSTPIYCRYFVSFNSFPVLPEPHPRSRILPLSAYFSMYSYPQSVQRPPHRWQQQLSTFGQMPATNGLDPRVLPGQVWDFNLSSQVLSNLFHLLNNVLPFRIEEYQPILQVRQTSGSNSFAVFQRAKIPNMHQHRKPLGFHFLV